MKIKTRLTILSTIIFGLVFTVTSIIVYISFYTSSNKVIFNELEKACLLTAFFYLEEDEISSKEHDKIKVRFKENITDIEVRVYNEENFISYGDTVEDDIITPEILDKVRAKRKYNFKSDEHYYSGIFYPDNQGDFVIFLKEDNSFFREQSNRLLFILFIVLIGGLIAIYLLSKLLSDIAYRPVNKVIEQVRNINQDSLNKKLISPDTNDEVQNLVETFNKLLERLSETFVKQKNFINYVSHEIKTPLTAISGNLEVFAQKDRSPEEYQKVVTDVIQNVNNIEVIMNNLKIVSGLVKDYSSDNKFRIDELVWDILEKIKEVYPDSNTEVKLNIPAGKDYLLDVKGNEVQLQMAIYNIIDNAVKFSDGKKIEVEFTHEMNKLRLTIKDFGVGIPEDEMEHINQAFIRGSNVKKIKGSGIGLSISEIIFNQNEIEFNISSEIDVGTEVQLYFPEFK